MTQTIPASRASRASGTPDTPDTPQPSRTSAPTPSFTTVDSPIGRIELESNGEAITWLNIEGAPDASRSIAAPGNADTLTRGTHVALIHGGAAGSPDAIITQAITELGEYFAGMRHQFTVPVVLSGTPFQQSVWAQLQGIGWGEHRSYADIAEAIGKTGASRAVGGAVGANPVPLIVGCHRVLARDGRITGYSAGQGIATKQWLLSHEGIESR